MFLFRFLIILFCLAPIFGNSQDADKNNGRIEMLESQVETLNLAIDSLSEQHSRQIDDFASFKQGDEGSLNNMNNRVSDWAVYSGILAGILILIAAGAAYATNRSARDIAYRELGEAKENIDKELKKIKERTIEANKKLAQYTQMLEEEKGEK